MALFLGIDGGGTGCRAAVADASGRILGHGSAGPANIASDVEAASRSILAAAGQAMAIAVGAGAVARELPHVHAGLGLAGANLAGAVDRLREALPFARLRVETDAVASAKGALGEGDGIVAAVGTGSVFAKQESGVIRQIGGWGFVLGDEGSGAVLGRAVLAMALRAADGLTTMTPLLADLIAENGSEAAVVRFAQGARPADFAAIAPRLIATDDPAALAIMAAAAADVAAYVDHLQSGGDLPVVFIGGLGETYAKRLAGRWEILPPRGTALDGALILAREIP